MKVLILRFSSIGDIVLTTPVVRALKTQRPDVEVHFATKAAFQPVLAHNPYLDKLHLLGPDLNALLQALKAEQFAFIIDLHNNLRTFRIKRALGVKSRSFNKLNLEKWLLVNLKIDRLPHVHIVDRYLAAAAPLGITDDGKGLDYFLSPADQVPLTQLPESHRQGYAAYSMGGQHSTKKLPLPRMIELCALIRKPVVLLGGKEDRAAGEEIVQYFTSGAGAGTAAVFNACGLFSLNQSASLLQQAEEVYTHDTGLMHIAAAFGKKIYSIWGNTVPEFGMYPFRTEHVIMERPHLYCRPCSKIGYEKCPQGHFKCMWEIDFSVIGKADGL